ncbi:hypothetical protein AB0A67_37650, partial [Streptomyces eurythermus]
MPLCVLGRACRSTRRPAPRPGPPVARRPVVAARPERRSLNGALTDIAVETLTGAGHEVRVS